MPATPHAPPPTPRPADAAISAAVQQLLDERGESVVDLAHFSRISVAALYRKLHGSARWWAADVATIAAHYGLPPGELFRGEHVLAGEPPATPPPAPAARPLPRPAQAAPRQRPPAPGVDPLAQPFSDARSAVHAPLTRDSAPITVR